MRALLLILMLGFAGPAQADGAALNRLPRDVMAPQTPRPDHPDAIVGVLLQGMSGAGGKVITFGQAFRAGDWPRGSGLAARWNGRDLSIQTDIKARWGDGSVRHAILSITEPAAREAEIALFRVARRPAQSPVRIADLMARGFDMRLDLEIMGHAMSLNIAPLIERAMAQPDRWLQGPLATELRATKRVTDQLTLILDLRAQADGAARLSVAMFNDMLGATTGEIAYALTGVMGGQTAFAHRLSHTRFTGWREVVWAAAAPSEAHVVYDPSYLIASGAVPAYDPTLEIQPGVIRHLIEKTASAPTGPMSSGIVTRAMPNTGGRADIGMLPTWSIAWLRTQDRDARAAMLQNAEAAVPWRLRDPETGRNATLSGYPRLWADARSRADKHRFGGTIDTRVDDWKLDNAHQPDLAYLPYLITGDRHFLDALHAQHFFSLFNYNPDYRGDDAGNLEFDEVRGQAWATRTHAYAVFITPDDHPFKREIVDRLEARLAWYPDKYRADPKQRYGGPATAETAGWISGVNPKGIMSNWQQDYFAMAIAQAAAGESKSAWRTYGMTRRYMLNRFLREDFRPEWSTHYHLIHGDTDTREPFATWAEIARANLAADKVSRDRAGMEGRPETGWGYAAQARAGYAAALSAFRDPMLAEAYAFIAAGMRGALERVDGFAKHPEWTIVPRFPNGSVLPLSGLRAGNADADRLTASSANTLLFGGDGGDTLTGGAGDDLVAGWDGDDVLTGGAGQNYLAGGLGRDQIVVEGGWNRISMGPGADVAFFGLSARGEPRPIGEAEIWDFNPREDVIVLPARAQGRLTEGRGGALISGREGETLLLRGVRVDELTPQNVRFRGGAG